ncbi:MAG: SH3 domain-containing protein [Lachnospiraceae bacterium]|nr:SH3 domain-containing protein [Lachnospiraceae bacterium]
MERVFRWKKTIPAFLTAVCLTAGIAGAFTVTAWALPASGTAIIDSIRVRESAVTGDAVDSLSAGQEVEIEDETAGSDGMTWYQISYEVNGVERTGWVRSDLLETSDDEAETSAAEDTESGEDSDISYVPVSSIPDDVIPDGFEETTITYGGGEISALYSESRDLYLVYAVNAGDDTDAGLFICDVQSEVLTAFVQFELQDGSVILLDIPDDERELVSDRFTLTECIFENGGIPAYQLSGPDELVADDASIVDYYYVYGVNEIGETGWYVYHAQEGSIQKNVWNMQYSLVTAEDAETADADGDEESVFALDSVTRMAVGILAVICLLLILLAVIFSVRYRRLRNILEEETAGDPEKQPVSEPKKRRSSAEKQQDEAEPSQKEKKSGKDVQRSASGERAKPREDESGSTGRTSKKPAEETASEKPVRKSEPLDLRMPSDDVDVMDLDSMEDEDYEALLNKYLDENFSDEDEKSDSLDYDLTDPEMPDIPSGETDGSDVLRREAAGDDVPSGEKEDRDVPQHEAAGEGIPSGEKADGEAPFCKPGDENAAVTERDSEDPIGEDYDMPDFIRTGADKEKSDDMDLDLPMFNRPNRRK